MKIPAILIKAIAAAGMHHIPAELVASDQAAAQPPIDPVERQKRLKLDRGFTLAAHSSHSSHGSHGSHQSHRSSSTGGVSGVSPSPLTIPSPPRSGGPTTSGNLAGSPPAPTGSGISVATQRKLTGAHKDFKWLVFRVQTALYGRGYYSGAIDGIVGAETKASITAFERVYGLKATGTLSDDLLDALGIDISGK